MLNQQKLSILSSCSNEKDQHDKKNPWTLDMFLMKKNPCLKPDDLHVLTVANMFHVYGRDFYPGKAGLVALILIYQLFLDVAQF